MQNANIINPLIGWLPFIILVVLWVALLRKQNSFYSSYMKGLEQNQQIVELTRETNVLLKQISQKLDKDTNA